MQGSEQGFFFVKKKQKTSIRLVRAGFNAVHQIKGSFLVLFYKKELFL
jgi:hypothetical protein